MKNFLPIVVLTIFASVLSAQTVPSPQQTDQIILDNNSNGKADPGDKIRYKVTIQNTGGSTATGTTLNAVPDPKTTFVGGSFRSSPLAFDDGPYTCLGNVGITVPDGASDLLANDFDDAPAGLTATAGTFATTQGGSITIATNGSFTYNPPRGYEGSDTYVYTVNDGNAVAGVTATNTGTVTFTVSGMIWFINNNAGACAATCDGRMSNPYTSLADFNTANALAGGLNPDNNDNIFVYESATAYTSGIVLRSGQKLIGQDVSLSLNGATGLSQPTFGNALPVTNNANGTFASITNGSGDGVTLSSGNTLRGFRVGNCSDFAIENSGTTTVGDLVVTDVTINNTTGGGFDASHGSGAGMNAAFISLSSTGGTNGINLTNCAGVFAVLGGTVTNPTGTGILISGGSVAFSTSSAVSDNTGFAVDIDNHDSGNATFLGNITSTGSGIRVQNCGGGTKTFSGSSKSLSTGTNAAVTLNTNAGATINFTGGGLAITTTSGTGFDATGGATAVTVQGTGNTISSTSATALNVANTTIGASGLTFQSISSGNNTAAADPANGIVLNTTGNSGGLTVTGTGSAGSGGTIQNCTGAGVSLATTSNVSLSHMNIQGGSDDGINGSSVTGFSLSDCTVTNNGNSTTDEGIELNNLLGTCSMSNCTVTNNAHNNFKLLNNSGTLASLTVSGSTFEGHNNASAFSNNGFLFETASTAAVTSVLVNNNSIFRNNFALGMQILAQDNSTISSFIVNGCTFTDTGTGNSQEIAADFSIGAGASMTYQFLNNTLTNHNSHAFNTFTGVGSTGSLRGTIEGNTIGNQANIDSGSKIGNGMRININGGANARIKVNSNTIHQIPTGRGIECIARNGTGGASFIVTNNTITAPTGTAGAVCGAGVLCPLAPIHVQTNCVTVCNSACSVVSGNTAYDPTTVPGGGGGEFSVQLVETGASALTYEGNTSLSALQNLINANPACITKSVSGTITVVAGSTCAVP